MFVVYESYNGDAELFFFRSPRENAIMLSTTKFSADNYAACYVEGINLKLVNLCTSEITFSWAILMQDVDYDYFILQIDDWNQFHQYLAEHMEIILTVCKIRSEAELIVFPENMKAE